MSSSAQKSSGDEGDSNDLFKGGKNLQTTLSSGGQFSQFNLNSGDSASLNKINLNNSAANYTASSFTSIAQAPTASTTLTSVVAQPQTQFSLTTPLNSGAWDKAMGERVVWMARNSVNEAQILLNPRNMGPIEIKMSVSQDQQASVQFMTANPVTRDALESSLPRLREMFQEAGLQLADSNVSQQQKGEQSNSSKDNLENRHYGSNMTEEDQLEHDSSMQQHQSFVPAYGVDYFA